MTGTASAGSGGWPSRVLTSCRACATPSSLPAGALGAGQALNRSRVWIPKIDQLFGLRRIIVADADVAFGAVVRVCPFEAWVGFQASPIFEHGAEPGEDFLVGNAAAV